MPHLQVPKPVALSFLDAAKLALEHLGVRRLEMVGADPRSAVEMTRLYGDVRRLRDYLQRSVVGFGDVVDLEVAPGDVSVLVACGRHAFDAIDARQQGAQLRPDERHALSHKQQALAAWILDLAQKPLLELPLRRARVTVSDAGRALLGKLQAKLFSDCIERTAAAPPAPNASTGVEGSRAEARTVAPSATAAGEPPLFDHSRLVDPRLRALVALDLRSYARAAAASDFRIAMVLLGAILEGALIDHVLPRRQAFQAADDPSGWDLASLLLAALGENAVANDRSLAQHVFAAKNLLRPSIQAQAPTVVTPSSHALLKGFVQRCLHALGYGAPPEQPVVFDARNAGDHAPRG